MLDCHVFSIKVTSMMCFSLIRLSSGKYFYITAALYCFFLVHCSKTWLKLVNLLVNLLKLVETAIDILKFDHFTED